ncbi:hypothetical protein EHM82_08375, partial [bacterium]
MSILRLRLPALAFLFALLLAPSFAVAQAQETPQEPQSQEPASQEPESEGSESQDPESPLEEGEEPPPAAEPQPPPGPETPGLPS